MYVKDTLRCIHFADASLDEKQKAALSHPSMLEWVLVSLLDMKFLIGCIYIHPQANENDWHIILSSISKALKSDLPIFLLGDYNARHSFWDDSVENFNGLQLLSFLQSHSEFSLLNIVYAGGVPTHEISNSIIDLAITNSPRLVSDFFIDKDLELISDHFPICLVLDISNLHLHNINQSDCLKFDEKNLPAYYNMLSMIFHKVNSFLVIRLNSIITLF
jgi:hypothetical protein